jgi:hypothetical protein
MDPCRLLTVALDPALILLAQGMHADPWQRAVLRCASRYILLNCSRGAGKTRVTSALALHQALFEPGRQILLVSRSQRQSMELLRYVKQGYRALGRPLSVTRYNETCVEFNNGSRINAVPGREETIRGLQGIHLLILDEAARIPDALYGSVRPMTGTVNGRTICLSTPFGQRGFFWRAWCDTDGPWTRFRIPWSACPRLGAEFIEQERRQFGDTWIAQEYECDFTSCAGLVYPGFQECVVSEVAPSLQGRRVGGIDWGFRNPFAALWGVLDHDDVLWLTGERYLRETPLHEHAAALPRGYLWYADPAGATEIAELRAASHKVLPGNNSIRLGIQAVTARLRTGRLKVAASCRNLLAEARLYRYPSANERSALGEHPVDDHNHALGALRYLISCLDARFLARLRQCQHDENEPVEHHQRDTWNQLDNPAIWTSTAK